MQKLFVSFSGILQAIFLGKVTQEDLATGLFYFGCGRGHALDPNKERDGSDERRWVDRENLEVGKRVHLQLVEPLLKAEAEGRVAWKGPHGNSYGQLNELLTANGLPALKLDRQRHFGYNYDQVKELVAEQLPDKLHAVWRD